VRIFFFGESAAMGDPEPAFGVPRMLQAMLELKFPGNKFEVINVAMTAINSHVIREIARDCAPLDGDVWVIYMGNNEVVGPFGGGTIFGRQVPSLSLIRATLWLRQFRIVQWLSSVGGQHPREWEGMEMFLKQQVPRDDPRMKRVYSHFRKNLDDIVQTGSRAGAKIILSTVAVNLRDCPPFASRHGGSMTREESAEIEELLTRGVSLVDSGQLGRAHEVLSLAQQKASSPGGVEGADIFYHLARCELALGSNDLARLHFNLAKELDTLRFRADDEINAAIRACSTTASSAVKLIDAASLIAKASTNGIPGGDVFYEHVHFTFLGNYLLARAIFEEVAQSLPRGVVKQARADFPSIEECARRLGWTDWHRLEIYEEVRKRLQQPPFSSQYGHAERDREWQKRIEELDARLTPASYLQSTETCRAALQAAPDDWVLHENLALLLEANNDATQAIQQWKEVMRLLPHDTQAYYHLGNLLDSVGRSGDAVPYFREALRRNADLVEARNGLGLALANLGQPAKAQHELELALRLNPKFTQARVNLGYLLAQQKQAEAAIAQYELALKTDTNSAAAHVNLGKLLNQRGDRAGAISHYRSALMIDPKNAVAHFNLGNALLPGDSAAAERHYAEAVRARPDFGEARLSLALVLAKNGNAAEALVQFAEAIRLRPESVDAHFNYGVALANAGRTTEAAQQFSEILRLQPDHARARTFLERSRGMAPK